MIFKRAMGQIFDVELTPKEEKVLEKEIKRSIGEVMEKHALEIDALTLWQLHEQLGFGHERLWRFFTGFRKAQKALLARYEMDDCDDVWLCTHELKEYGIDVAEWEKRMDKNLEIEESKNGQ